MSRRALVACAVAMLIALGIVPHGDGATPAEAGTAQHTNRLAHETSPYLRLHAHNPVDWYPWGPEALERADAEDKPIFLSVGYSTCYWCHVMERLVFADAEIAALMNRWFINVKVDREERPDLDHVYMTATQMMTGRGGWPNSVFLTPDLKPFYAGTYFPPADDGGRPGFPRVIEALHQAWESRREAVEAQADRLASGMRPLLAGQYTTEGAQPLTREIVDAALADLRDRFDPKCGGFSDAPKFPSELEIGLLLDEYERSADASALEMSTQTLRAMAMGGIRDHLGGGFHRYATDHRWRIPHFEKMLYNQAQLVSAYVRAYDATGDELFKRAAVEMLGFVDELMTSPEGAFYTALDSETDATEGLYYVWTSDQVREALGRGARKFLEIYELEPMPELDAGVLYRRDAAPLDGRLERASRWKNELLASRSERELPLLDTKVITGLNGQMIGAYAEAYGVLGEETYLARARRAADFVLGHLRDDEGRLLRIYAEETAKIEAYLEDYAHLAQGLLGVYRVSGDGKYLAEARALTEEMLTRFWDGEDPGFFFTSEAGDLPTRVKNPTDGSTASGTSVAVHVLLTLADETGDARYREAAVATLRTYSGEMRRYPGAFVHLITGLARHLSSEGPPGPVVDALVSVSASASAGVVWPGETFGVTAHVAIEDRWHVNAHPASLEYLIPTTLELASDLPIEALSVVYADGHEQRFGFADETLSVYQGEVQIHATVRLGSSAVGGRRSHITVSVGYQACDDSRCLAPATAEATIEIEVGQ